MNKEINSQELIRQYINNLDGLGGVIQERIKILNQWEEVLSCADKEGLEDIKNTLAKIGSDCQTLTHVVDEHLRLYANDK